MGIKGNFSINSNTCTAWKVSKYEVISGPYFPVFNFMMQRLTYGVSLRIQSECGKMRKRITPNTDSFYAILFFSTFDSTPRLVGHAGYHYTKNEVFHQGFFQEIWQNPQFLTNLLKFTEEIFKRKVHFLCSALSPVYEATFVNVDVKSWN